MKTLAVAGTFADFRIVRGRKVAALVIEIPLERADEALKALGGIPNPTSERWVAIAPLNGDPGEAATPQKLVTNTPRHGEPERSDRRSWDQLLPSQQAAIRCGEPEFQRFAKAADAEGAADYVRVECGVRSRRELDTRPDARQIWQELDAEFFAWQRNPRAA